jgi:hypothetical protein
MPHGDDYYDSPFALSLHLLFPAPARNTPIQKILDFRTKHAEEIPRLRLMMAAFEKELSEAEDEKEIRNIVSRFSDTVDDGLLGLHKTLNSFGVEFTTGALTTLLSLKAPMVLDTLAR